MKFAREFASKELFEEMFGLLKQHYQEIAHHKDIELDPDYDTYLKLEEAGALRMFIARDSVNLRIIGYAVYFVRANLHYRKSLQALQDVLYVDPARRGFGARLLLWCNKELRKEGVQLDIQHVKAAHDFGPMLERLGYEKVDVIYAKRLDKMEVR